MAFLAKRLVNSSSGRTNGFGTENCDGGKEDYCEQADVSKQQYLFEDLQWANEFVNAEEQQ